MIGHRLRMRRSRNWLAVWRGLKKLGRVNARHALRILPYSLGNRADLKKKSGDIETWGGQSVLIATTILEERPERRVVAILPAGEERA